jgi:hypothetical protein
MARSGARVITAGCEYTRKRRPRCCGAEVGARRNVAIERITIEHGNIDGQPCVRGLALWENEPISKLHQRVLSFAKKYDRETSSR